MARQINREHARQIQAKQWVREAVAAPHVFLAFDRSGAAGQFSHMREKARGVAAGTPDVALFVAGFPPIWTEWKAGTNTPTQVQQDMGDALMAVGHWWSWATSVVTYCEWLRTIGVPLHPNAAFLAQVADASADSAVARAEAKAGKAPKSYRPAAGKPTAARLRKVEGLRRGVLF